MTHVAGLLLAAGAGRRFGGPKALATLDGTPLVLRALAALVDGGCAPVRVVLGAQADDVRRLLPDPGIAVTAPDWESGMGASLRCGMAEVATLDPVPDAVLVHLVDLPDVGSDVVARLVALAGPRALARAEYGAGPGHPVLCGRERWPEFVASADGDRGAREFLAGHPDLRLVDCSDLAGGRDVDRHADLGRLSHSLACCAPSGTHAGCVVVGQQATGLPPSSALPSHAPDDAPRRPGTGRDALEGW